MEFRNALPSKKCRRWELNNGAGSDSMMGMSTKMKLRDSKCHDCLLNQTLEASKVKKES